MNLDWMDAVRLANAVASAVAVWVLLVAWRRQRKDWNAKTMDHWYALVGWVVLSVVGSVENVLQNNQGGSRVIITSLVVVALTLRALFGRGRLEAERAL